MVRKGTFLGGCAVVALLMPIDVATAQEAHGEAQAQESAESVSDIVVSGSRPIAESEASALAVQKNSVSLVTVAAADSVGRLPDQNIAQAAGRLPGVAVERDQGQARYISLRGAPNYWTTLSFDGINIVSPEGRDARFDSIPSAIASQIVVSKAVTPEMPGEHVALLIGAPNGQPPLVRLHSECLTGDVLGSLKCDCGPQLDAAIRAISASGWGILLYLRQEGRGIGLINKLRAYALQDQGFDTVDANTRLGFAVDSRNFAVAARMLDLLGQRSVRLLTNNPEKVAQLEGAGIRVIERVSHILPANPHNERYLATKRDRTGHQF